MPIRSEPPRQRWGSKGTPSLDEIKMGKSRFVKVGLWDALVSVATRAGIFYVPVPARTKGASTVPRCYFYVNQDSFENGDDNIGCIDVLNDDLRIVLDKNNVSLLSSNLLNLLSQCNDQEGWLEKYVKSDYQSAAQILESIKSNYLIKYNLIL